MAVNFKETEGIVEDILNVYYEKAKKNRKEHIGINDKETCGTCIAKSNVKSLPGVMTPRGCAYAGSKGVVWGPVKDVINISHGPIGCGMYSWGLFAFVYFSRSYDKIPYSIVCYMMP